ncbi:MAG: hypothetical protein M1587_06040 [Thaumarchaeota archaeon]|nr:hypothetical protein [Nitrososphaerota archaeon]
MLSKVSNVSLIFKGDPKVDWMSESVAFQKVIGDRLFFSARKYGGKWRIASGELLQGSVTNSELIIMQSPYKFVECLTPTISRVLDKYVMAFAAQLNFLSSRSIFFAESKSLDGPWLVKEHYYSPHKPWEGRDIDLGPGSFIDGNRFYVFYSCAFPGYRKLIAGLIGSPTFPSNNRLWKYVRRRIGILEVNIDTFEIKSVSDNPIPLDSVESTISESVFCPGYAVVDGTHLLFEAGSIYSKGFPFEQGVCFTESKLPPTKWTNVMPTGLLLSTSDLPQPFSNSTATFDTPDPVVIGDNLIDLYFSSGPAKLQGWAIFKCTFKYEPIHQ